MSCDSFVIIADSHGFCKPFFEKAFVSLPDKGRKHKQNRGFCSFGRTFKIYLYILDKGRAVPYYK